MEMELPSLPEVTVEESFSFSPVEFRGRPANRSCFAEGPELPNEPRGGAAPCLFVLEVVVEETCWFEGARRWRAHRLRNRSRRGGRWGGRAWSGCE